MALEEIYQKRLLRLGQILVELSKWWWISLFLSILIFPLIFFVMLSIRLIFVLMDLRITRENDPQLEKFLVLIPVAIIAESLVGIVFGYAIGPRLASIGILVGWIVMILAMNELVIWADRVVQESGVPQMAEFGQGIKTVKMGVILSIIGIGVFIIPIGMKRAGSALVSTFGPQNPTSMPVTEPGNVQYQQPNMNFQPAAAPIPAAPASVITQSAPSENLERCPHCGTQLPVPGTKFCGSCGKRVNY